MWTHTYVHTYVWAHTHVNIIYIHTYTYIHLYTPIYTYIHIYTHIYTYIHTYTHIYKQINIHTHLKTCLPLHVLQAPLIWNVHSSNRVPLLIAYLRTHARRRLMHKTWGTRNYAQNMRHKTWRTTQKQRAENGGVSACVHTTHRCMRIHIRRSIRITVYS